MSRIDRMNESIRMANEASKKCVKGFEESKRQCQEMYEKERGSGRKERGGERKSAEREYVEEKFVEAPDIDKDEFVEEEYDESDEYVLVPCGVNWTRAFIMSICLLWTYLAMMYFSGVILWPINIAVLCLFAHLLTCDYRDMANLGRPLTPVTWMLIISLVLAIFFSKKKDDEVPHSNPQKLNARL